MAKQPQPFLFLPLSTNVVEAVVGSIESSTYPQMVNNPPKKPPLASHLTNTQGCHRAARIRCEIETALGEEGLGDPTLLYDEEKDLFRFADGVFAFSGEHAIYGSELRRGLLHE